MRIITKILGKILYPFYSAVRVERIHREQKRRSVSLAGAMRFDTGTFISQDVVVQNYQNRPDLIVFGKHCGIYGNLVLFKHGGRIIVGDYCYIGPGSRIWSAKSIVIGNRVLISYNVSIHDSNSHPTNAYERHLDYVFIKTNNDLQEKLDLKEAPIVIEDDVWIGFNATIHKGVTIGKGAIVGSNTVITSDVPPGATVVGNPQRIINKE